MAIAHLLNMQITTLGLNVHLIGKEKDIIKRTIKLMIVLEYIKTQENRTKTILNF
ncbi:hypothetical protein D3C80_1997110 [compost metagenome]